MNHPTAASRPLKVLHIEDDASVARAVARLLRIEGCEVTSVASGEKAVRVIDTGLVPDVILVDYHLPFHVTGDEVVAEIATRLGYRPPTILFGSDLPLNRQKMMTVADHIFEKPADMFLVIRAIRELLLTRDKATD
jgi:CheY-like chemotaxis protein